MGLVYNLFKSKETINAEIKDFINEYGMEEAVKKFTLKKLVKKGLLIPIEKTELYKNSDFDFFTFIYNKDGIELGQQTLIMNPFYKDLGGFQAPCVNGNMILSRSDSSKWPSRTYGVVASDGEVVVEFGKYFGYVYIPDGVALRNAYGNENVKVMLINAWGDLAKQEYFDIEEKIAGATIMPEEKAYIVKEKIDGQVEEKLIVLRKGEFDLDVSE